MTGGKSLSVYTAAGPFTTSENLNYEPLLDLLKRMLHSLNMTHTHMRIHIHAPFTTF
jgi:hypothetical protein